MGIRFTRFGEEAVKRLASKGFTLPDQPSQPSTYLDDITDLDDVGLVAELALLTAWADYAASQHALAIIEEREAERSLAVAEANHWKRKPVKSTVAELKALSSADESVVEAQDALDQIYAYRKLLQELVARYERDAAVLSRELTRRTSASPVVRRRALP